jgi:hypothetical protein
MRMLIAYTLIACGSLTAQQSRKDESPATPALEKLHTDLAALMGAEVTLSFKQQVADDIMAVSEKAHRPPVTLVQDFANALTRALAGRRVANTPDEKFKLKPKATLAGKLLASQKQLTTDIQKVLQSAGTSTADFHETVDDAQTALIGLGVSMTEAQNLAELLRNIGMQVRGPEDMRMDIPNVPLR